MSKSIGMLDEPDEVQEYVTELDRLRAELAEAKAIIGVTDDTIQRVHAELAAKEVRIAKLQDDVANLCGKMAEKLTDNDALCKEIAASQKQNSVLREVHHEAEIELAEAKAALEVYDRTFPKKSELELHAALEAANATIEHEKAQTKIVLDSYATENQQLHDRVEAANARIEQLEQRCSDETIRSMHELNLSKELAEANARIAERLCDQRGNALEAAKADLAEAKAVIATAELCARNQTASITAANARIAEFADKGTLQALRDANARAERAEARIAELERWNAELTRTHNSYVVMNSRLEDRAERAEARIAEFADKGTLQALRDANNRAERAETECKALREALQWIETKARLACDVNYTEVYSIHRGIADKARAALNPSPAEKSPT